MKEQVLKKVNAGQGSGQLETAARSRLAKKWNLEMNKLWDEWQWCLDHKFKFEAIMKYELKEQLRRKIFDLENIIKDL